MRKKDSFGPGKGGPRKGVKRDENGPKKKISIFFHRTCGRAMTGPHNRTCGARAVLCGITDWDRAWPSCRTIMLRRTSKRVNKAVENRQQEVKKQAEHPTFSSPTRGKRMALHHCEQEGKKVANRCSCCADGCDLVHPRVEALDIDS